MPQYMVWSEHDWLVDLQSVIPPCLILTKVQAFSRGWGFSSLKTTHDSMVVRHDRMNRPSHRGPGAPPQTRLRGIQAADHCRIWEVEIRPRRSHGHLRTGLRTVLSPQHRHDFQQEGIAAWGEVLGDQAVAAAILDRLLRFNRLSRPFSIRIIFAIMSSTESTRPDRISFRLQCRPNGG